MGTSTNYIPPNDDEWKLAKRFVTNYLNDPENTSISKVLAQFSVAMKNNESSKKVFSKSVAGLMGFIFSVINEGLENTLEKFGFENLLDSPSDVILKEILYFYTDDASLRDDSIMINALSKSLENLDIIDFENLEKIDAKILMKEILTNYIQMYFSSCFFEKIENIKTIKQTWEIINEINKYIRNSIYTLSFDKMKSINFSSLADNFFVLKMLNKAYDFFIKFYKDNK